MSLVFAVVVFLYGQTFMQNPVFASAVVFLLAGVILAYTLVGIGFEGFQVRGLLEIVMWSVASFVAIWLVNKAVPLKLSATPVDARLFAVCMGVAEESFFRLFLCTFLQKITRSSLIAIGVSSLIWSIYHISAYGGDLGAIAIVFVAGCVLGFSMLQTRRPDSSMIAHGAVNYVAS
jgi:membrane protease YdiL (CAAX protease family)